MTWSQEISQLITDVDQLTSAANVKKSELDASVASTEADKIGAEASITSATASFASAGANATQAEAHKNTALAIYGTNAAQQTAVASAQSSAALASGYAASASAALQQDLSSITAQALHRSPNAVTSIAIYDTSKDSDGGAWTEKCQNTSWYNETIYGKWLGAEVNEQDARYVGSTVSATELIGDPDLNNPSYWVVGIYTANLMTIANGQAIRQNNANAGSIPAPVNLVAGKTYRVRVRLTSTRPTIASATANNYGNVYVLASVAGQAANVTSRAKIGNPGDSLDFYITPSVATNLLAIYSNTNSYTNFESVSCREVTAVNTTSGDYYQLTSDGKFYRLWKNLLTWSEGFNNAAWATRAGATVLPDTATAPDGTMTADTITFTTSINDGLSQNVLNNAGPNGIATFSVWARVESGTRVFRLSAYNAGIGTNTSGDFTATTTWQRFSFTTFFPNTLGIQQCNIMNMGSSATVGNLIVWGAQLEHGATPTTYEPKTTIGTITEVFRGNKRDFPRLAAIIAESNNLTIYDLTEPGRPMWMRFIGTTGFLAWLSTAINISGISAVNGYIVPVSSSNMGGLVLNFAKDDAILIWNGSYVLRKRQLVDRNVLNSFSAEPGGFIVANTPINAIAMTFLPDAPTDPVTGLRVPTIAVATSSGASVIRHNGTVVTPITGGGIVSVRFEGNRLWVAGSNGGNWAVRLIKTDFSGEDFSYSNILYNNTPPVFLGNVGQGQRLLTNGNSTIFGISEPAPNTITAIRSNKAIRGNAPFAYITPTYNTGWMMGNIRRTYLSDVDVGSVTGTELVVNGTFTGGSLTGWTPFNTNTTIAAVSDQIELTIVAGTSSAANVEVPTQIGKKYSLSFNLTVIGSGTSGAKAYIGTTRGNATNGADMSNLTSPGSASIAFVATSTLYYITLQALGSVGSKSAFDNISVKEIVADRSYRAQNATINGSLTKSQLASGTSLVGYSGWSATNYLREPYSADLDFGTGEWSASAWINSSSLPRKNILTYTDDLSGWGPSNVTRTLAQPDPFGGNTATQIIATTSGGVHTLSGQGISTLIVGQRYTAIYNMKGIGIGKVGVGSNVAGTGLNGVIAIDLLAGTFSGGPSGFINKSIQSLGDGWWRFSYQFDALQPRMSPAIYVTDASFNNNWVGDGTSGYLVSRVQIEIGSAATEYQPVLDGLEYSGLIFDRAAASGPRLRLLMNGLGHFTAEAFDGTTTRTVTTTIPYVTAPWLKAEANYTTDGSLGIRVNGREVAVTRGNPLVSLTTGKNLLSYSESFDNSVWAKYIMGVTANAAIAPDGTTTADLIYPTASNIDNSIYRGGFPTAQKTHSVHAKAAGKNWLVILKENTQGGAAWFNLANGSIGTTSAGFTGATITPIGIDGWYRCSVTSTSGFNQNIAFGAVDADNTTTVVASGTNGIYLWGAQLESTSSVTSYAATNVAPLTIGNSFALDAPFPGSIALLKLGITVPTTEQSVFMYEQEKQLFRTNAVSVSPDAGSIVDMSYDDATDRWAAISTANESYWNGLVRASVTPVPAGSYSKIVTISGIELASRISTNPGVDVTIPPYVLREELVKRSETANKLNRQTAIYDYIGGFTGNITTGSTAITTVTNFTYPVSPVGARIAGTGIPANTTIVAVVGTMMYISAAATATTTGLVISFLDFKLPVGFETESVTTAGVVKQEGATKDYTRLFDGFLETIRFAVAPGATTWVRIQATKSIQ